MSSFTKLTTASELPSVDHAKEFPCGDQTICIANIDGVFFAMGNVCLHRGGPLGQGEIENGKVICPWHGWQWDPKTGQAAQNPNAKLSVYNLDRNGEDVLINL